MRVKNPHVQRMCYSLLIDYTDIIKRYSDSECLEKLGYPGYRMSPMCFRFGLCSRDLHDEQGVSRLAPFLQEGSHPPNAPAPKKAQAEKGTKGKQYIDPTKVDIKEVIGPKGPQGLPGTNGEWMIYIYISILHTHTHTHTNMHTHRHAHTHTHTHTHIHTYR